MYVENEHIHDAHKSNISGIELHAQELSLATTTTQQLKSVIVVDEVVMLFILVSKQEFLLW
jgi:hypothetical protein